MPSTSPLASPSEILRPSVRPRKSFETEMETEFPESSPQIQTSTMNYTRLVMQGDLLRSQNMEVFKTVMGIQDEMKSNHAQVTGMLRDITNALQGHSGPTAKADDRSLPLPAELQADHPDIKYWTQKDYQQAKKAQRRSTTIQAQENDPNRNIMTWFVEDDDGEPVDNDTVDAIRALGRSIWFELLRRGIAPETWEKAGLDARDYFEHHMCSRFPQLSYGEGNWKAHMIATLNYSSWYGKHVGHTTKVKAEPSIKKEVIPAKRSLDTSVCTTENKKPKIDKKSSDEKTIEENSTDPPALASPIILKNSLAQVFTATEPIAKITAPSPAPTTTSPTMTAVSTASGPSTAMTTPITTSASTTQATSNATDTNFAAVKPSAPSESATAKPSKKAKAGNALNAKSLCKREWIASNPNGTEDEYALHWTGLGSDGQLVFEKRIREEKARLSTSLADAKGKK